MLKIGYIIVIIPTNGRLQRLIEHYNFDDDLHFHDPPAHQMTSKPSLKC